MFYKIKHHSWIYFTFAVHEWNPEMLLQTIAIYTFQIILKNYNKIDVWIKIYLYNYYSNYIIYAGLLFTYLLKNSNQWFPTMRSVDM